MTAPRRDEDAVEQRAAGADERVVLDDDRARARRFQHAADGDARGEVDPRPDLGARADEHVRIDHRRRPTQAPTLRYDGGMTTTPSAEVGAAPDGRPAGHDPPRPTGEVVAGRDRRAVAKRERAAPVDRRPIGEAGEDRRLDLGPDPPAAGRRRIGLRGADAAGLEVGEDRAGRRPAPVAARSPTPADGGLRRHATASRGSRCWVIRPPPASTRPSPRRVAAIAARPSASSGRSGRADHVLEQAHRTQGGLDRDRVRTAAEVAQEERQPPLVDPARRLPVAGPGRGTQRDELAGDLVRGDRDDAVAAHRQDRQRPGVVAGEDRDVARPVAADPGDLVEVAAAPP